MIRFSSLLPLLLPTLALPLAPAGVEEELKALETFDAVWRIVDRQHFDPTFNGVDWDAVRQELRPRAAEATDVAELRFIVNDMLGRLGQSHFSLIPKEELRGGEEGSSASPAGTCGLDLRWLEENLVIVRVEPESSAEQAGVRPGWLLRQVAGKDVAEMREAASKLQTLRLETALWRVARNTIDGEVGSSVELLFETPTGEAEKVRLERVARDAIPFDLQGLPTFFLTHRWSIDEYEDISIGVVHFSNWFKPLVELLDEALVEMRGCDGIVIDLRSNTGGDAQVGTSVAGHFFDERVSLGTHRMRNRSRPMTVRPRRRFDFGSAQPYAGPVAILADETTGSCSEVFTGGMRALGRARVFGSRTAGAALPATTSRLPNGDSLLHAIAEFETSLGEVLEGDGVRPDEAIVPTRSDWVAGRDVALEAALAWIADESDA